MRALSTGHVAGALSTGHVAEALSLPQVPRPRRSLDAITHSLPHSLSPSFSRRPVEP